MAIATKPENSSAKTTKVARNPDTTEAHPTNGDTRAELAKMRHDPEAIRRAFETGAYPYKTKIKRAAYEKHKAELQVELLKVQKWVEDSRPEGRRAVRRAAMPPARAAPSSVSWNT